MRTHASGASASSSRPTKPRPTSELVLAALPAELARHDAFRARLLEEFPDLDEETLADTLEGATDLSDMIRALVRSALDDEALGEGLSTRLDDMRARIERFGVRAKRKRQLALCAMTQARLDKLTAADFTASVRLGSPGLEVIAEAAIPAAYWKPQPPKLDRLGLIAALKAGAAIDGASLLASEPQLSVRTK